MGFSHRKVAGNLRSLHVSSLIDYAMWRLQKMRSVFGVPVTAERGMRLHQHPPCASIKNPPPPWRGVCRNVSRTERLRCATVFVVPSICGAACLSGLPRRWALCAHRVRVGRCECCCASSACVPACVRSCVRVCVCDVRFETVCLVRLVARVCLVSCRRVCERTEVSSHVRARDCRAYGGGGGGGGAFDRLTVRAR